MITKLPWRVIDLKYGSYIQGADHDELSVAETITKNDAEFIVMACNAYGANQTEIARLQAEIIQLRGKYNRLCEANSLDDVVWGKTWTEMEKQQSEIAQLKAKLELCRESFIECRVCSMMPGEVEKITTEALAAIERRDGE